MSTKEKIEIMQAFVDGKVIERRDNVGTTWRPVSLPGWDWIDQTYRIKQQITLALYTCYNTATKYWSSPQPFESNKAFMAEYGGADYTYHHRVPNSGYTVDEI